MTINYNDDELRKDFEAVVRIAKVYEAITLAELRGEIDRAERSARLTAIRVIADATGDVSQIERRAIAASGARRAMDIYDKDRAERLQREREARTGVVVPFNGAKR